jgi:hypothetical protein
MRRNNCRRQKAGISCNFAININLLHAYFTIRGRGKNKIYITPVLLANKMISKVLKGGNPMKKLLIKKDEILGKRAEVNAKKIYETLSGQWIAEVDKSELEHACVELCCGVDNCSCTNMSGEAALDDDGKEYRLVGV